MKNVRLPFLIFMLYTPLLFAQARHDGPVQVPEAIASQERTFFIENKGQWDSEALFLAQTANMNAWLTKEGIVYDLYKKEYSDSVRTKSSRSLLSAKDAQAIPAREGWRRGHIVRMKFRNTSPHLSLSAENSLPGYYNYLVGSDRSQWADHVQRYRTVMMKNVYEGIDTRLYFDEGMIRYDMLVDPGADPGQISFALEGADKLSLDSRGNLVITTSVGRIVQGKLYAYQELNGKRKQVACAFSLKGNSVGFSVKNYDRSKRLIIDPLIYSTLAGGDISDQVTSIATYTDRRDQQTRIYIAGLLFNIGNNTFPRRNAITYYDRFTESSDGFISKFVPIGTGDYDLEYSTFFGWRNSHEMIYSVAADTAGYLYATGFTVIDAELTPGYLFSSLIPGYRKTPYTPLNNGTKGDIFVIKVRRDGGDLVYGTLFGGSNRDMATGMTLDAASNVYITGHTYSTDFERSPGSPPLTGDCDAFIVKLKSDFSGFDYSRLLGGSGEDKGTAICIDSSGSTAIIGNTLSDNFPTTPNSLFPSRRGLNDIFVYKLKADGSGPVYSTFFGGDSIDFGLGISSDRNGNAYFCGQTYSPQVGVNPFPIGSGAFNSIINNGSKLDTTQSPKCDGFITKINPAGTSILFSTYIGGDSNDVCSSLVLDSSGSIYVTGLTWSPRFPRMNYTFHAMAMSKELNLGANIDSMDAFGLRLSGDGKSVPYATFLGGTGHDNGMAICLDKYGDAYIAGITNSGGRNPATRFPVTKGAYDTLHAGNNRVDYDVFISGIRMGPNFTLDLGNDMEICAGDSILIGKKASGAPGSNFSYSWKNAAANTQNISSPTFPETFVRPSATTKYYISVQERRSGWSVDKLDSITIRVNPLPVSGIRQRTIDLCTGADTAVGAAASGGTGVISYTWRSSVSDTEISNVNAPVPRVRPVRDTTLYYVAISDGKGCSIYDTVTVRLRPAVTLSSVGELDFGELASCTNDTIAEFLLKNTGTVEADIASVVSSDPAFSFVSAGSSATPQFTIPVGGSVTVKLRYAPQTAGAASASLRFVTKKCAETYTLSLRGRKLEALVSISRTAVDFGTGLSCDTEERTDSVYIINKGTGAMKLGTPEADAPFSVIRVGRSDIPEKDSTILVIRYKPVATGVHTATLRIPYEAGPCTGSHIGIALSGALLSPELSTETTISMPAMTGCESFRDTVITLRNTGSAAVTVIGASSGSGNVKVTGPSGGFQISGGSEREVEIHFEPKTTGDISDKLIFSYEPCDRTLEITLTGKKEGVNFAIDDSVKFGELVLCRSTSEKKRLLLKNLSNTPGATIKDVRLKTEAGIFAASAAAGDKIEGEYGFDLVFSPDREGAFTGELELVLEPCDISKTVFISGRASRPALTVVQQAQFGSTGIGMVLTRTAKLRNTGTSSMRIGATGTISAPFAVTAIKPQLPVDLQPGEELEIELSYTGQKGIQTATLRVESSEPCPLFADIELKGEGSDDPAGSLAEISAGIDGEDFRANPGERISVPVSILSSRNLQAQTATNCIVELRFNRNILSPVGQLLSNTLAGDERIITVAGTRQDTTGVVCRVEFLAMLGNTECTGIQLTKIEFSGGTQEIRVDNANPDARFCLSDICDANGKRLITGGAAFFLRRNTPNPAGSDAEMEYSLPGSGRTELYISDMMGRKVLVLADGVLTEGLHLARFDVSQIPSGMYFCVLRSPYGTITNPFHVLR